MRHALLPFVATLTTASIAFADARPLGLPSAPMRLARNVSSLTTGGFSLIVFWVLGTFTILAMMALKRRGDSPEETKRASTRIMIGLIVWTTAAAIACLTGLLRESFVVPPLMIFMATCLGGALAVAFSSYGKTVAMHSPIRWLIAFQAFRLPLEVVLHQLHSEGAVPIQMTFEGHNFDIITGGLALTILVLFFKEDPPRWVAIAFNVVGTTLLLAVIVIAMLSSPIPIKAYPGEPLTLALYFPYVWIVPVCVAGALFGHVVLWRRLLQKAPETKRAAPSA